MVPYKKRFPIKKGNNHIVSDRNFPYQSSRISQIFPIEKNLFLQKFPDQPWFPVSISQFRTPGGRGRLHLRRLVAPWPLGGRGAVAAPGTEARGSQGKAMGGGKSMGKSLGKSPEHGKIYETSMASMGKSLANAANP